MKSIMREAHLRVCLPKDLMENFEKRLKVEVLQTEIQRLVNTHGLCTVLDALSAEAARMVLTNYCPDAVKILDVLRATQEEICDQSMK